MATSAASGWRAAKRAAARLTARIDGRADFASEPIRAVEKAGLRVTMRESIDAEGCSIAATYTAGSPPVVQVARSRSLGRQAFSVLHEYGHHLVADDLETVKMLAGQPDYGVWLEEVICDSIAATLLLPDEIVPKVSNKGPLAEDLTRLCRASEASREACCVRIAELVPTAGYVMLATDRCVAQFTVSVRVPYQVARETPQPDRGPIGRTLAAGRFRGTGPVRFRTGTTSPDHYVDALRDGGYVFALFYSDRPPWETLSLGADQTLSGYELECEHCEYAGIVYSRRCGLCLQPRCPECDRCGLTDAGTICPGQF